MSGAGSSTDIVPTTRRQRGQPISTDLARQLVANRGTKTSVLQTLTTLSNAGCLKDVDGSDAGALKRKLTEAAASHSTQHTLYGPLIQSVEIGVEGCKHWEYMNPFAYLYLMSVISHEFAAMMRSICVDGVPLRIIIYADALVPGSPQA